MSELWFKAVRKFGPESGESWRRFIEWSGLTQLTELVSIDNCLCPCVIEELNAEDWQANVHQDYVCFFFRDLEYLLKRVVGRTGMNILAAMRNPGEDCRDCFHDERFEFMGYDVVDLCGDISALTSCGGFEKAFHNDELSDAGLVSSFDRAYEIRQLLRKYYPEEDHAKCDVWAIWIMRQIIQADEQGAP